VPLTNDEKGKVLKSLIRCNIDLNQAINYALDSKYEEARQNLLAVVKSMGTIIDDIDD